MNTRTLSVRSATLDPGTRSIEATLATENPVEVFDRGRIILEVISTAGADFPAQVPLLVDHARGVPSMAGSVRDIRREGDQLVGRLYFSENETGENAWRLIRDGHLSDVSVGYRVTESVEIQPGRTATVRGKSFAAPSDRSLHVASAWRLFEVSCVPIGADQSAKIRSQQSLTFSQRTSQMPRTISEIAGREVSNMTLPDLAKAIVSRSGLPVPDTNDRDLCRAAFSSVAGAADLAGLVNASILRGFAAAPDTTAGWVRAVPLPNFLAAQIAVPSTGVRLEPVPRGSTAPSVSFSIDATGWRLARFGAQFVLDEQDYEDSRPISVMETALEELGRAARRIIPDLVYSLILANGNLADEVPLFDATHGNLGTAALADTALDAGLAAVGNQVSADEAGDPIHLGLSARYLVVPPDLEGYARRLCRNMATGHGDLIVRSESRLGAAGVVDPRTDEIVEGSATNWLLAGPSEQAAGIVVGLLNGRAEPTIREFRLGQGEFGLGYDIQFSVGVAALSGQPLYFSDGTV